MPVATITPQQLADRIHRGETVELIDVRTPAEFEAIHATIAHNVPLDSLNATLLVESRNGGQDQPLYVICQKGGRSAQACEKLVAAGLANVVSVAGGTQAWESAGLPVQRGQSCISLERQVRIAAGGLALAGALLGGFVHPYFIALSGLVGAGLMFAGITDSCMMGMLLARMPWNTRGASGDSLRACCNQ